MCVVIFGGIFLQNLQQFVCFMLIHWTDVFQLPGLPSPDGQDIIRQTQSCQLAM